MLATNFKSEKRQKTVRMQNVTKKLKSDSNDTGRTINWNASKLIIMNQMSEHDEHNSNLCGFITAMSVQRHRFRKPELQVLCYNATYT